MIEHIIYLAVGAVAGFVVGFLVMRNNVNKLQAKEDELRKLIDLSGSFANPSALIDKIKERIDW